MEFVDMSTRELKQVYAQIQQELAHRRGVLQKTCKHPEWTEVMYMRINATYRGCEVCGMSKERAEQAPLARTNDLKLES